MLVFRTVNTPHTRKSNKGRWGPLHCVSDIRFAFLTFGPHHFCFCPPPGGIFFRGTFTGFCRLSSFFPKVFFAVLAVFFVVLLRVSVVQFYVGVKPPSPFKYPILPVKYPIPETPPVTFIFACTPGGIYFLVESDRW